MDPSPFLLAHVACVDATAPAASTASDAVFAGGFRCRREPMGGLAAYGKRPRIGHWGLDILRPPV
jgi:hypothetical protein